jgi:hypothetical protein
MTKLQQFPHTLTHKRYKKKIIFYDWYNNDCHDSMI